MLKFDGQSSDEEKQLIELLILFFDIQENLQHEYRATVKRTIEVASSLARKDYERAIAAFRESGASNEQMAVVEGMIKEYSKETLLLMVNNTIEPSLWRRLWYEWRAKKRVRAYDAKFKAKMRSDFRNLNLDQVLNRMNRPNS